MESHWNPELFCCVEDEPWHQLNRKFDASSPIEIPKSYASEASGASGRQGSAFSEAWRLYHDSFGENDDTVLDVMFEAVRREPDAISPSNINAAIRLFREMGRDDQASEIVNMYIDGHGDNRDFFDLTRYPFEDDVTDKDLREAFADKYESFKDQRDPTEVILECARSSGWNRDDEKLLAKLTVDDFVALFERLDSEDTPSIVKWVLRMGIPSTTEGRSVGGNAADALRRIAERSPLNKRRVQGYGVDLSTAGNPMSAGETTDGV